MIMGDGRGGAAERNSPSPPCGRAGGIGLAASLHLLAAVGGAGSYAEVDANPNPLRDEVLPMHVEGGIVTLGDAPGIGVEPDLRALAPYIVLLS